MSQKSERKKAAKAEKQAAAADGVVVVHSVNWHAEDVQHTLAEHRESCKDPNCTHAFFLRYQGTKTVAMLQSGEPKKIFLAFYGEGTATEYKPYAVLNLATGEEIADVFDENGKVSCCVSGEHNEPICLTLLCHNKGVLLSFDETEPDSVSLRCAEPICGRPIRGALKLAPQPKAEYPNVYCRTHGIQPAYFTCKHVRDGMAPMILNRPTAEHHGLALCGDDECDRLLDEVRAKRVANNGDFGPACAPSLNEILDGKLELYHQQAEGTNVLFNDGDFAVLVLYPANGKDPKLFQKTRASETRKAFLAAHPVDESFVKDLPEGFAQKVADRLRAAAA